MDELTDIVLWAEAGDQLLLEQPAIDADLDAGHWRLPVLTACQGAVRAHAAWCGVGTSIAAALEAWLQAQQISLQHLLGCTVQTTQHSPAWHPQPQRLCWVKLSLKAEAAHTHGSLRWRPAQDWLADWHEGDLLLNPLAQGLISQGQQFDWAQIDSEQTIQGVDILPVRSHTLPPASHTNTLLVGDGAAWLVDPSPANAAARDDLIRRIGQRPLAGIFLTHHHGDHHQQSVVLAQHYQLPIRCSADTHQRIPKRFGSGYWQDAQIQLIDDGEILCQWKGQPVRAHAVPGHDAGQLALMPDNRRWILVGDLIQGIGTVVIAKPEGDMVAYFDSLQWVIDQQPGAIIPSHGQVMGSAYRIEQTLQHRKLREQQILQLHAQGHSPQAMVEIIYAEVDKRLWGLARMNIDCHLDKLVAEGRV